MYQLLFVFLLPINSFLLCSRSCCFKCRHLVKLSPSKFKQSMTPRSHHQFLIFQPKKSPDFDLVNVCKVSASQMVSLASILWLSPRCESCDFKLPMFVCFFAMALTQINAKNLFTCFSSFVANRGEPQVKITGEFQYH